VSHTTPGIFQYYITGRPFVVAVVIVSVIIIIIIMQFYGAIS